MTINAMQLNWLDRTRLGTAALYTNDHDHSNQARELLLEFQIPFIEHREGFNANLANDWTLPTLFANGHFCYGLPDIKVFVGSITSCPWLTIDDSPQSQEIMDLLKQKQIHFISDPGSYPSEPNRYPILLIGWEKIRGYKKVIEWVNNQK